MEAVSPIEFLKNKLAELQQTPEIGSEIILEYKKAILVLELIGSPDFDDNVKEPEVNEDSDLKQEEPKGELKSYFERFMEAQKNRNTK